MSYKTDNQIFADITGIIRTFLAGSGQAGWTVVQGYQPRPFGLHDKLITLTQVYCVPVGFQGSKEVPIVTSGAVIAFTHVETWREEISIQIGCLCNRDPENDTADTWTAVDMAKRIKTFLNSTSGVDALLTLGYNKLRIDNIRVGKFTNSSEEFQLIPGFDLVVLHDQSIAGPGAGIATSITGNLYDINP